MATANTFLKNPNGLNQKKVHLAYGYDVPAVGNRYVCTRMDIKGKELIPHLTNLSTVREVSQLGENIFLATTENSDNIVITNPRNTFFALIDHTPQVLEKLKCKRLIYSNSQNVAIQPCTTSTVLEVSYIDGLFRVRTSSSSTYFCIK